MGTTNEKIGAASQCSAETRNLRDLNRRQQTPSPTMMMKTALKSAILCACLSALALGASGEAHGDHSGDDKMMMEGAMNDTMMGNMTEMANDTIAEGEMPVESSDDGRRRLLQLGDAISGAVDNAKETAKDVAGKVEETGKKVVDKANEVVNKVNETIQGASGKVNDFVAGVQGNMTMNGTEGNMTMNGTEMANDTIDGAGEMMPEEGEMPVESSDDGRRKLRMVLA